MGENAKQENEMTTKTITEMTEPEAIVDNISDAKIPQSEEAINMNKLAELRAKNIAKQKEMQAIEKAGKVERSIEWGVIGLGQCGSRISEVFGTAGYKAIAINTAIQDLKGIKLPDATKILLRQGGGLSGSARELILGEHAAESNKQLIMDAVNLHLGGSAMFIVATSLGGGSGAGAIIPVVHMLQETNKPIVVIAALPLDSEDVELKKNALETLQKLLACSRDKKIANLILVDNAKIESVYKNISQMDFFSTANAAIVRPLDVFNVMSAKASDMKPLDPTEFLKLLVSEGITIYGEIIVSDFHEDVSIANAIIENLQGNLLAGGFDLKQTKFCGVLICANKNVWSAIPSSAINFATTMVQDAAGSPLGVYKGMYVCDDIKEDVVKIFSMFSGLGLPGNRITELQNEVKALVAKTKLKDDDRNLTLTLDTGSNETVSAAQKIKDKIMAKSSIFGKMTNQVIDRRK